MASLLSRRTSHILLILLGLFLAGTIVVLTTANAYFSIDTSAYVLAEELGTWEEIRHGLAPSASDSWTASPSWSLSADNNNTNDPATSGPWRHSSPTPWNSNSPAEKIPRIIHQTWKDEHLPPRWQAVRDECAAMHPDYQYMLWTDADSRKFIAEHYDWFLPVFDGYPYPIQRADVIRYFVLHHYGGIYMDLDIGCRRRLDPLLRFEVILPKTIPVGVSNDLLFSAKGHPFTDQLIHNLVTFNHQYLTNYPTVMFSTGPMFVSASYGLYVDVHGPATPSNPKQPEAGLKGIRILPKSLYGKNAKVSEAPDAFFSHFYGSSWHSNDAGFLIFLRKYGRILIFVGVCVVVYGLVRTLLPRFMGRLVDRPGLGASGRRRRSQQGWISLPVGSPSSRSLAKRRSKRHSNADEDRNLAMKDLAGRSMASTSAANPARSAIPAPRAHKLSLPLFQLQDPEPMTADPPPQSVLAWMGQTLSRPSSRNDGVSELEANRGATDSPPKKKGVLYLPAYFVRGDDGSSSSSQPLSPSTSSTSSQMPGQPLSSLSGTSYEPAATQSLGEWASSLIPANWRGPSPAPSHGSRRSRVSQDVDLESLGSQDGDDDEDDEEEREADAYFGSKSAATSKEHKPLLYRPEPSLTPRDFSDINNTRSPAAGGLAPPPYEDSPSPAPAHQQDNGLHYKQDT